MLAELAETCDATAASGPSRATQTRTPLLRERNGRKARLPVKDGIGAERTVDRYSLYLHTSRGHGANLLCLSREPELGR